MRLEPYNFTASNEAFLGMISSINGSRPGYVSSSFWRRPRCTEDLTLDRLLGGILEKAVTLAHVFEQISGNPDCIEGVYALFSRFGQQLQRALQEQMKICTPIGGVGGSS